MNKALILTGKVGNKESYQLLIPPNYLSATFDRSSERRTFYDNTADDFVNMIIHQHSSLNLIMVNGIRVNPETGGHEKVQRLEDDLVHQFEVVMVKKIQERKISYITSPGRN